MTRRYAFGLSALNVVLILACVSKYNRPLVTRGLPEEDRYGFIMQNGSDIPVSIRNAFVEGYVIRGMAMEYVFQMYGRPDRSSERDFGWEYLDKDGKLVTGIVFKNDKVDSIYGDFTGGRNSRVTNQP